MLWYHILLRFASSGPPSLTSLTKAMVAQTIVVPKLEGEVDV